MVVRAPPPPSFGRAMRRPTSSRSARPSRGCSPRFAWRAATRSRPERCCSPRTTRTTGRRATRRRRCSRRRRGNWPISRPAASRPKSSRPRPIWRMRSATLVRTDGRSGAEARRCCRSGDVTKQSVDQLRGRSSVGAGQGRRVAGGAGAGACADGPGGRDRGAACGGGGGARRARRWPNGGSAQRRVTAPAGGRIADVLARPGETMAAGAPVVSLLPPGQYLRAVLCSGSRACDAPSRRSGGAGLRRLPGRSVRDDLVHFAAGGIHAAADLQRVEQGQLVFLSKPGRRRTRRSRLNPGQPIEVRPHRCAAGTPMTDANW